MFPPSPAPPSCWCPVVPVAAYEKAETSLSYSILKSDAVIVSPSVSVLCRV